MLDISRNQYTWSIICDDYHKLFEASADKHLPTFEAGSERLPDPDIKADAVDHGSREAGSGQSPDS
jgi:hypothetical protein